MTRPCYECGAARSSNRKGRCVLCKKARRREYMRTYYPKWRERNYEAYIAYQRAYSAEHIAGKLAAATKWQKENRALQNARIADWKRRHPEKAVEYEGRRRARKRGAAVHSVDRDAVIRRDEGRCHICSDPIHPNDLTLDHVVPLSRGGEHAIGNLALAHRACNFRKGTRLMAELA